VISRRQGLTAAVIILLLAISFTAYLRLDVASLERQAVSEMNRTTGGRIRTEHTSFSLLHGAMLRLRHVTMADAGRHWALSADEIQVNLKLWPLLFGEAEPSTVYLIAPTLSLTDPKQLSALPLLTRHIPETRIGRLIVRQGNITIAGLPYAGQGEVDIRKTSRGDNLLLEVRAAIGDGEIHLSGHTDGPARMFGKIDMDHVPIPLLLMQSTPLPHYDELATALTYDISEQRKWQLFGDITLRPTDKKRPVITLRGKLKGNGRQLAWDEGFIRLGDRATITTDGACAGKKGCTVHAKTDVLPLDLVGTMAGLRHGMQGNAKASTTLTWRDGTWLADADTSLNGLRWAGIDFPDLHVTWSGIRHEAGQTGIASVDIAQPGKAGHIRMEKVASDDSGWRFSATTEGIDGWWVSMANGLLALRGNRPALQGSGMLTARIRTEHRKGRESAAFEINADQARVAYGQHFTKPKGVSASVSGQLETGPKGERLTLSAAQLADSTLRQMQWKRFGERQSLGIRKVSVDFSGLHGKGIHLPGEFDKWRGSLKGNIGSHTLHAREKRTTWLDDLDATLRLRRFGTEKSGWDGALRIRNGILHSGRMTWHGAGKQQAAVSGTLNLATRRGTIDLRHADFAWPQGQPLPSWFDQAAIHGHIHADRFRWAGNRWEKVTTDYRLSGHRLALRKLNASLAGGSMNSNRLDLIILPGSIHLAGPIRLGLVSLQQLHGLKAIVGAAPRGYLYMNAFLEGDLPFDGLATWRGNGDIEIQRGGWNGGRFTLALPNEKEIRRNSYRFSRASSRFHIRDHAIELTDLQIESGDTIADGSARITGDGTLSGQVRIRNEKKTLQGALQGKWPHVEVGSR